MKKFVSGILSTALFIGSGIPAAASSDYGYKRPSIHRNNYHHINSNTGFSLKMGEKLVSVQDYFKLSRDTGEYLVLDSNKQVTNLLKRASDGSLQGVSGDCIASIITVIASIGVALLPIVAPAIAEIGIAELAKFCAEILAGGSIATVLYNVSNVVKDAVEFICNYIKMYQQIPSACFGL